MFSIQRDSYLSWIVCLGSFLCKLTMAGVGNSFGIVIDPLVTKMDTTIANISWIKSFNTALIMLFSSITSIMLKRVGYRIIIFTGTLMCSAAFLISAFLHNYIGLFLVYGVIGGAGFGMLSTPSSIACVEYFDQWKAVSTGIAMSGSGIGTMLIPILCNYITIKYGSNGYFIAISMIISLNVFFAISTSPLNKENENTAQDVKQLPTYRKFDPDIEIEQRACQNTGGLQRQPSITPKNIGTQRRRSSISFGPKLSDHIEISQNRRQSIALNAHISMVKETDEELEEVLIPKKIHALWQIFKDKRMFLFCLGNACYELTLDIPFLFLQEMMIQEAGIPRHKVGTIIMILGLTMVIGKLLSGIIVQFLRISPIILYSLCMFVLGCCSIGLTFCLTYEQFAIITGSYGLVLASFGIFKPLILIEFFGGEKLGDANGLLLLINMFFVLWGPPIVGLIIDHTGIYRAAFYLSGSVQLIGAIVNIFVFIFQMRANEECS